MRRRLEDRVTSERYCYACIIIHIGPIISLCMYVYSADFRSFVFLSWTSVQHVSVSLLCPNV